MGKRGPQPQPEKRQVRLEIMVSPECAKRLERLSPPRKPGRPKAGERTAGTVVCEALERLEEALLDQSDS